MRRSWLLVLVLSIFAMLPTACGPQGTPGAQNPPDTASAAPTVEQAQPTAAVPAAAQATARPAGTAASAAPAGGDTAGSDPAEEIIAAFLRLYQQESFRVEQNVQSPDGDEVFEIEVVPPDGFHLSGSNMEMIIVGDTAWVNADNEGWMQTPGDGGTIVRSYVYLRNEEEAQAFRDNVSDAAYSGEETTAGGKMKVYTFVLSNDDGDINHVLWVDANTGLPATMQANYTGEDADAAAITNRYYDYNAAITILPPQ